MIANEAVLQRRVGINIVTYFSLRTKKKSKKPLLSLLNEFLLICI